MKLFKLFLVSIFFFLLLQVQTVFSEENNISPTEHETILVSPTKEPEDLISPTGEQENRVSVTPKISPRVGDDRRKELEREDEHRKDGTSEAEKPEAETRRTLFLNKLKTIKDEHKKAVVSRLDTNINAINKRITNKVKEMLVKMSNFLTHLRQKVAAAKTRGEDTSAAESAIAAAQTALDTANTALTIQSGKDYTIQITSDTNLGQNVSATVQQLRTDLKTLESAVKTAKDALLNAYKLVQKLEVELEPTKVATP